MEFVAFHSRKRHGEAVMALRYTAATIDGHRRKHKATRLEADAECVKRAREVPGGVAQTLWRSTYTYRRAKDCVRVQRLLARHQRALARRVQSL